MKVAISSLLTLNQDVIQTIEKMGYEVVLYDHKEPYTKPAEVIAGVNVPQDQCPEGLKFIQLCSAGFDHVNLEMYRKNNVAIANGRGMYSVPIAEYCIAHILNHYKNIPNYAHNQTLGLWERLNNSRSLEGAKVLLLGTGSIADAIAVRLHAFHSHVDGINSDGRAIENFETCYPMSQLDDLLKDYDIVISTLPKSPSTYHVMGEKQFEAMAHDALFMNVGRGVSVDLQGLMSVLDRNLAGVILDVFEEEPLPHDHPLWKHPKAVITPHASTETNQLNAYRLAVVLENLKRYAMGEPIINKIV